MIRTWIVVAAFSLFVVACGADSTDGTPTQGTDTGGDAGTGGDFGNMGDTGTEGVSHDTAEVSVEAAAPGSLCDCDSDCQAVEGHNGICVFGVCMTRASADCSAAGSTEECGANSRCWGLTGYEGYICWPDCGPYSCAGECDGDNSCAPSDSTSCDPTCGSYCEEVTSEDFTCSEQHPDDGDCPSGNVCQDGTCVPFACDDQVMEPNETRGDAKPFSEAVDGLQICSGDEDWFSVSPTDSDVLHVFGVHSFWGSGNLDVELTDAADFLFTVSQNGPDDYNEEGTRGPTELEAYAMVGAPDADTFFLNVYGVSGAVNNYDLVYNQVPFVDGTSCTGAGYTTLECTGISGSTFSTSELIMFPVGHPADPYIGDGTVFQTGFSSPGRPHYQSSAHLWGRRDLIMAIRHGIHAVQEDFEDTTPLGIGDIGTLTGETPWGHPWFTHHYGRSIDVSYYIDPQYHRDWGNWCYRQICADATSLSDWSAVDDDGRTGNFGECVPGSDETHIVDIPRTARFLAGFAEVVSVYAIGVDTSVYLALREELQDLADEGVPGASEARTNVTSADRDSSWVWHFNHMHLAVD